MKEDRDAVGEGGVSDDRSERQYFRTVLCVCGSPAGTGVEEEEGPTPNALLLVANLPQEEKVQVPEPHDVLPPDVKVLDHLSPGYVETPSLVGPVLGAFV